MRDLGNTLIVVEHDEDTMREADYLIDVGPGAGVLVGNCCGRNAQTGGSQQQVYHRPVLVRKTCHSSTSRAVPEWSFYRSDRSAWKQLAKYHGSFPIRKIHRSDGGIRFRKSTLINSILKKAIAQKLNRNSDKPGKFKTITGIEHVDRLIDIDQSPIGRTPRSNPATYTGVFDDIRDLFAQTNEAKIRGYKKGRFSFNVKGGRCEACSGDGSSRSRCTSCQMFTWLVKSATVPATTVKPWSSLQGKKISRRFWTWPSTMRWNSSNTFPRFNANFRPSRMGLGYVTLGATSYYPFWGEAQRMKLASELHKRSTGKSFYILDEPTTGLHTEDIARLLKVLARFVDDGNTVLVIEHNLDVIKTADHIIDLGPEGGVGGGTIIATGTQRK